MPLKVSEKSPHRLLVEGKDDLHTIVHLVRRHGLDYDDPAEALPYIHSAEGYSQLLDSLPVAAKSYRRLGIVLDADVDPSLRWRQVRDRLRSVGIDLPTPPGPDGSIVPGIANGWRVGVWLMPDNSHAGTLETFLSRLIPDDDACWPFAETVTKEAKKIGAKFPEKYFLKAQVHTWLSWQEEPGQPFGTAITAACFRTDTANAKAFVTWFKQTFS